MKQCSSSLVIREMQRFYLTQFKMAICQEHKQFWEGMWGKKQTHTLLMEMQMGAFALESSMEIPQKT